MFHSARGLQTFNGCFSIASRNTNVTFVRCLRTNGPKDFFFFFNPSCVHSGCLFFSDSVTVGRREGLLAEKQMKKLERKKKIKIKCWIEKH